MKKLILLLFTIFSLSSFGEIVLKTSDFKPSVNQVFRIQVDFINEGKKDYKLEGIENFQVVSRGSSSSFSYVNGEKSSSVSEIYSLVPLNAGEQKLIAKTKDGNSNEITLQISKAKPYVDLKNTTSGNSQSGNSSVVSDQNYVSFKNNLKNKSKYYFGEKIPYMENFLTLVRVGEIQYAELPDLSAFSVKDMGNRNMPVEYFQTKDGRQGVDYTTYMGIIMPNSSGKFVIKSGRIAYRANNYNDLFFGGPLRYIGGNKVEITILPLPSGAPEGFQNVVGTPEIKYNYNKASVSYGETILLNLKISGDVNLDSLDKIVTQNFEDFNVFETVKSSGESIESGKYFAEKEFEIAIIPKVQGDTVIPEIKIPYFNTKTKKYENMIIPSHKIHVSKGGIVAKTTQNSNVTPSKDVEEIKITSIGEEKNIPTIKEYKYSYITYGLIVIVIIQLIIIVYILRNKKEKSKYDLSDLKNSKDIKDFYNKYCNFMKNNFNFSPKVHLEDRLVRLGFSKRFIELNSMIEEAYYKKEEIDIKKIVKDLKRELKSM